MAVISHRVFLPEASLGALFVIHIKAAVHPHAHTHKEEDSNKDTTLTCSIFLKENVLKCYKNVLLANKL